MFFYSVGFALLDNGYDKEASIAFFIRDLHFAVFTGGVGTLSGFSSSVRDGVSELPSISEQLYEVVNDNSDGNNDDSNILLMEPSLFQHDMEGIWLRSYLKRE